MQTGMKYDQGMILDYNVLFEGPGTLTLLLLNYNRNITASNIWPLSTLRETVTST